MNVRRASCVLAAVVAIAAASSAAQAQLWAEVGDALELIPTAQIPVGVGALSTITGFVGAEGDVDMYCITISEPMLFLADVSGGTIDDSQLFLFDANGLGVTHNDDDHGPFGTLSRLNGVDTRNGMRTVVNPGQYFLAISGYNSDPLNAAGALIWANAPFGDETPPDGAGGALAGWSHDAFASNGTYSITLRGVSYHVPEPGTLSLLVLGGLAALRRRRA